jgi:hypothetical protein
MTTRRTFIGWLSAVGAALGIGVRPRASRAETPVSTEQNGALDAAIVKGVADAVLPSELGNDGIATVSRAFTQWIGGYRVGVELVHPYGSTELRRTGESPVSRWRSQLAALDSAAREKHRKAFPALTRDQKRELVMSALGSERLNRLPDPLQATHVAMALLAWYFATPGAVDLCYNAKIDRNQCRPLVHASRQPLPLRNAGRPS